MCAANRETFVTTDVRLSPEGDKQPRSYPLRPHRFTSFTVGSTRPHFRRCLQAVILLRRAQDLISRRRLGILQQARATVLVVGTVLLASSSRLDGICGDVLFCLPIQAIRTLPGLRRSQRYFLKGGSPRLKPTRVAAL